MKTLHFSTVIDAPAEAVWKALIAPDTYREWTSVFMPGSYFEGSWEQGEGIRFLTPEGEGMVSVIAENRPYEFLSMKHLGYVKDGVEDTTSDAVRAWAPAFEDYTFSAVGDSTKLEVSVDVQPDEEGMMAEIFPKALAKLKEICES